MERLGDSREGLIPACAGKTRTCGGVPGRKRAHPRVCGENLQVIAHRVELAGSSPRVRGKLPYAGNYSFCPGLIPACAGKTRNLSPRSVHLAAHPRVCGENVGVVRDEIARQGSSPRVRGKPKQRISEVFRVRLIPACAGKTCIRVRCRWGAVGSSPRVRGKPRRPRRRQTPPTAHPRVCGENPGGVLFALPALGSSPRVRGKRSSGRAVRHTWGLIPACAGKTTPLIPPAIYTRAHPRVCGENASQRRGSLAAPGSSPRVRGKPQLAAALGGQYGLIPACAGKTCTARPRASQWWAHPRVCGENTVGLTVDAASAGSSPRVRGKLPSTRRYQATGGLIPACAGKTDDDTGESDTDWAHPRVCGENADKLVPALGEYGSSPRVRGKRGLRTWSFALLRLIPACAGKTRRGRPR